jgi:glycosyltransferase involved in cell wall biosynthesis
MSQRGLDVIIPCHDKASEIEDVLRRILSVLDEAELDYRLIVVVDGFDAACISNINRITDDRIKTVVLPLNEGKGSAIRAGFKECRAEFVAFLDGDLDLHPIAVTTGIRILNNPDNRGVAGTYGSKFHKESNVRYPLTRRVSSKIYRRLIKAIFGLDIEDTQTGVKVFRIDALAIAIPKTKEYRFLFDVELLAICGIFRYQMVPMPVQLDYQYSSSINLLSAFRMIIDTAKLGWRIRKSGLWLER